MSLYFLFTRPRDSQVVDLQDRAFALVVGGGKHEASASSMNSQGSSNVVFFESSCFHHNDEPHSDVGGSRHYLYSTFQRRGSLETSEAASFLGAMSHFDCITKPASAYKQVFSRLGSLS